MYPDDTPPSSLVQESTLHPSPQIQPEHFKQLETQYQARGEILFPCVPELLQLYLQQIFALFSSFNSVIEPTTLAKLPKELENQLISGFATSPHAKLIFTYQPSPQGVTLTLKPFISSVADQYQDWVKLREPPLFGTHPDAKVMAIAAQFADPGDSPILDIGAGTGRNTLPLAQLGYPVDAVELTPAFVEQIQEAAQQQKLPVRGILGDILDRQVKLQPAYYQGVILCEVIASHFGSVDRLRLLLARISDTLRPGGLLLFSLFLAVDDYEPDKLTRELSQVTWSCIFTRSELAEAMERLPLSVLSDESVLEYEREHLAIAAWPPTGWFIKWCQGENLFPLQNQGKPPMELRWILCQRR
ncbi:class I SAM-dependent methyltransferase [Phormidium pseudopriestleyi FRX01]|uniref:Class I SAM-dependent methyltransferase n=1 Tax=Phormidium pseudopriestleyi FRX01 TaxID=1759528 RepID=A0ABS3FW02_9CYAN|nr:class I SAM-dependent methyltransferase [Phormidium pseudopriestleyi]MBO0351286.1 class I SAM-dependent methyltransferase [Phormidium pseudopriestleyi FRX01]